MIEYVLKEFKIALRVSIEIDFSAHRVVVGFFLLSFYIKSKFWAKQEGLYDIVGAEKCKIKCTNWL